jgi:hypothetical protein
LKLLKRQRHKESISCKEEEPISINHVKTQESEKKKVEKESERGRIKRGTS